MRDAFVISRRSLLSAPIAATILGVCGSEWAAPVRAAEPSPLPILPLSTNFSYWDHHWIQWIDHPVYEAIEVALSQPTPETPPLVRLWLTERAAGKRQVYYFNDAAVARAFPQESHVAEFALQHDGEPGFARNLSLAFTDKDGVPIRWEMRFPAAQRLSTERAGLKPQNGHGALMVLLFWYVDLRADGGEGRVRFGDAEYLVRDAAARPDTRYRAAYNAGAYVGIISYGSGEITPTGAGFRSSWSGGRLFQRQPATGRTIHVARFQSFGRPSTIELGSDAGGAVLAYRHEHDGRAFSLDFDSPLDARSRNAVEFRLAIEGHVVGRGTVAPVADPAQGRQLRWAFAEPDWAREVNLTTSLTPDARGGYAMRVGPMR
jgi:hypothetical protein